MSSRAAQAQRYIALLTDPLQASYISVDSIAKSNYITVIMEYDEGKVDEMVLALLHLTSFNEQGFTRAWKGHDWDALNRLHDSGFISDPKNKNKSVGLSQEGARRSEELFWKFFGK